MDRLDALRAWLESTALSQFMNWSWWAWPTAETLHFVGLTLLLGTVGLYDLRLMGFFRSLPPAQLRRLLPWGVGGFLLNLATGTLFFTGIPGMYLGNPAFRWKLAFLALAGLNVAVFYLGAARDVEALRPGEQAPPLARIVGGVSLTLWLAILVAGRMIAFYKP